MAGANRGNGGSRGGSGKGGRTRGYKSVGAAAMGGNPNGAILDDDDEVKLQQRQRFDAWKKGKRGTSLPENGWLKMYESPKPRIA